MHPCSAMRTHSQQEPARGAVSVCTPFEWHARIRVKGELHLAFLGSDTGKLFPLIHFGERVNCPVYYIRRSRWRIRCTGSCRRAVPSVERGSPSEKLPTVAEREGVMRGDAAMNWRLSGHVAWLGPYHSVRTWSSNSGLGALADELKVSVGTLPHYDVNGALKRALSLATHRRAEPLVALPVAWRWLFAFEICAGTAETNLKQVNTPIQTHHE